MPISQLFNVPRLVARMTSILDAGLAAELAGHNTEHTWTLAKPALADYHNTHQAHRSLSSPTITYIFDDEVYTPFADQDYDIQIKFRVVLELKSTDVSATATLDDLPMALMAYCREIGYILNRDLADESVVPGTLANVYVADPVRTIYEEPSAFQGNTNVLIQTGHCFMQATQRARMR